MYFFYYTCDIIGNNSDNNLYAAVCAHRRWRQISDHQCHWNPANQTQFLKTVIAELQSMISN